MKINSFNEIKNQAAGRYRPAGGADFSSLFEQFQSSANGGVKGLIKDSLDLSSGEIMGEIDRLCNCETGEKIDMAQLGELLKIYNSVRGS
ncbi:MAG: hypothetical protein LBE35_04765 [Clostridiales bacterium]|nr:hypothetical protein [Clostridiales bacterium]